MYQLIERATTRESLFEVARMMYRRVREGRTTFASVRTGKLRVGRPIPDVIRKKRWFESLPDADQLTFDFEGWQPQEVSDVYSGRGVIEFMVGRIYFLCFADYQPGEASVTGLEVLQPAPITPPTPRVQVRRDNTGQALLRIVNALIRYASVPPRDFDRMIRSCRVVDNTFSFRDNHGIEVYAISIRQDIWERYFEYVEDESTTITPGGAVWSISDSSWGQVNFCGPSRQYRSSVHNISRPIRQ